MADFVSFYDEKGFVPVRQNVAGSESVKHTNRRRELYRRLGIPEALLRGCDVLEFGPGSGDNAIYTDSLKPNRYKVVEGSKGGFDYIQTRINKGEFSHSKKFELELSLISVFQFRGL